MSAIKELFKEILALLPTESQEKIKTSYHGLIHAPESPKPSFLDQQQRLAQMALKIKKQGVQAAHAKPKYETEFDKLVAMKQEYQKVLNETTAPANDFSEAYALPQPETVADEVVKTELCNLLNQEKALVEAKKRLAVNFSSNPTLTFRQRHAKRTSLDDEDDMDLTDKVEEPAQPTKAPKTKQNDDTDEMVRMVIAEADQKVIDLAKTAGASARIKS